MKRRSLRLIAQSSLAVGLALCFVIAVTNAPAVSGEDAPSWLRQAASLSAPGYGKEVPAVVLLNESKVTVEDDGKVTTTNYYAVKVLTREGRDAAVAREVYTTDTGKVREMRAWVIRPSGEVKKYGKDQVIDAALVDNDVYNEVRKKLIVASDDVEPGAVFGYEATSEERSVFTQFEWGFQENLPSLVSRFTLALPKEWRAEGVTINHSKVEPVVNGPTYAWEMRDLPFIHEEPMSPPVTNIAPRLAVSYFPSPGAKNLIGKSFNKWSEVSRWLTDLSEGQAALDDNLAGKAKQLTASAKTEFERIQAIGRYVQSINYVSIQTGIGRGGGYRPHSAIDVFAKSYGDCKDKANLMRAMLKAVGIQSCLVSIFAGDRTFVREEWPSPQQFNHCIIAIKVSGETQAATVVTHPTLGRLMIFDPTDDNTPAGDLPDHEQGSFALIVAGDDGALLKMPTTPPEANRLERQTDVVLAPDGSITASVMENSIGQSAVRERRIFKAQSRPDYATTIERRIARGASGAIISTIEPSDNSADGKFALKVNFSAPGYGQVMQGRLLVFKPAIVARRESIPLTGTERKHPVVLQSNAYSETVTVKLPAGFDVDELPDPVKMDAPFGNYTTSYVVKDGKLNFTRTLVVRNATIPVADYAQVRGFFEKIRVAESLPVVLAKK
ncbi:MAG TPA: DUF3857 domain-containing protein [Blastocatellia bacterium]|nr:DUF3857 domain-containing protein [Blastocatellia bacterium]